MMEWSDMLPEILDIIAHKHITFYEDYPCFAGVCKSWRLAAARTYHNSNGPPSRLPSLMLAEKSDDHESRELFLLSNKSIRKIRLPEAYGKVYMSSCGWLLTVGKDFATQLINPLSHEIINLPKADTFPEAIHPLQPLQWDFAIVKVVLLMESKLVLVICGCTGQLGFCHIGDNKWTSVEQPYDNPIYDITFYNGQVYTFNDDKIQACNVNGKGPTVLADVTTLPENVFSFDCYDDTNGEDPALVDVATIPEDIYGQNVFSAYIVGLDDGERKQLVVITRHEMFNVDRYNTKSFQVLAYDLESGNWSKVRDFGTKTLFVGYNSSFWVEDTTGVIKSNCIYYTKNDMGGDFGIYHMSDGTIEPLYFVGESCISAPKWLQSM
ncbi:hypothetical protein Tco_0774142 [Tanacetum coccineum]|uniref:KIB1-4 beta-propeller domain-containing protein n=1 Tax=Tanacetum coccineum TaxID=301880 RepID=A0ABQ4ZPR6_9ASTR